MSTVFGSVSGYSYPETDPRRDLTVSAQDTARTEMYR